MKVKHCACNKINKMVVEAFDLESDAIDFVQAEKDRGNDSFVLYILNEDDEKLKQLTS